MLKAVIFDMDGVIIDSEPLHARANILALKKFGIDLTLDYVYQFIGNTILAMCETIKKDFNLEISATELSEESARQIKYLHSIEGYTPVPFVKDLVKDLYHHGIQLAIASSSTMELIEEITEVLEIRPYFHKLISGTSVAHSKPAPDIFIKACEELGVSPEESIIIEDSFNGVLAATRANIPVIGYQNSHSGKQDLGQACLIVESFEDIDYEYILRTHCHAQGLPATIAITNRLEIRELSIEDIPELYQLYQDDTFKTQGLCYATSLEEAIEKHKAYIHYAYHFLGFGLWGVFSLENNELIGHCGIEIKEIKFHTKPVSIYELGYAIKKNHRQQGYAKEALNAIISYAKDDLYIEELFTVISDENTPSIHLSNLLGFKKIASDVTRGEDDMSLMNTKTYSLYRQIL